MTAEEVMKGMRSSALIDKACQDAAKDIRDEVNAAHVKQGKWRYTIMENNKQTTSRDYDLWFSEEFTQISKALSDHTDIGDFQAMQFVMACWFVLRRCKVMGIDPTDAVLGAVPFDGGVSE